MAEPRGSSERTRTKILKAARELFANHGIEEVTVRDIAAGAGVTHALVHRYFGTKEEMLAEIIRREVQGASSLPTTTYASTYPLEVVRRMLQYGLTEARTTLLLIARAELAGLEPEKMLADDQLRPLGLMADWLREQQAGSAEPMNGRCLPVLPELPADHEDRPSPLPPDPALVSAVVGGAIFALQILGPWLMTSVGLDPADATERRREIIDILMDIVTRAVVPTGVAGRHTQL